MVITAMAIEIENTANIASPVNSVRIQDGSANRPINPLKKVVLSLEERRMKSEVLWRLRRL